MWSKTTLFDLSVRVPCIVAAPDISSPGRPTRLITENVDIYPTLVELCGIPMPDGLEGTSFVPLLHDPNRQWKKAAFAQCVRSKVIIGRMARTEQWKYNQWGDTSQEELYNLEKDPGEMLNLARDETYTPKLESMREVLKEGWEASQPVALSG